MNPQSPAALAKFALITIAILLFLPAGYFALRIPFTFIDDYSGYLDYEVYGITWLKTYFSQLFTVEPPYTIGRFRPMNELQNYLQWALWGNQASMHHLVRFSYKLISIIFVARCVSLVFAHLSPSRRVLSWSAIIAAILFAFVPNQPEARLLSQEAQGTMFLAASYFFFLKLVLSGKELGQQKQTLTAFTLMALFCLWSKEPYLFFVIPLFASLFAKAIAEKKKINIVLLAPIAAILSFSGAVFFVKYLRALKKAEEGHVIKNLIANAGSPIDKIEPIVGKISANAQHYLDQMLFSSTHELLPYPLVTLFLFCLLMTLVKLKTQKRFSLAVGSMVASAILGFVFIAYISEVKALRYAHPALMSLMLLVGIGLAVLEASYRSLFVRPIVFAACAYAMFFVAANYYNFIFQYSIQWRIGSMENAVRSHMHYRLNVNDTVAINSCRGEVELLARRFLTLILQRYHDLTLDSAVDGAHIHYAKAGQLGKNDTYLYVQPRSPLPDSKKWCFIDSFPQPSAAIEDQANNWAKFIQGRQKVQYARFFIDAGVQYGPWDKGWQVFRYCGKSRMNLTKVDSRDYI